MSRQEAAAQYAAALKQGRKTYHDCVLRGRYPYPQVLDEIEIQPQNLEAVKAGMLKMAQSNRAFQALPFQAGAKTGSAQISAQTESNAVFVCFAPFDDPEIAVAVVVEHGGSGGELASIAADILSYYFSFQESREEIPMENTLIR